MSKTYPDPAPNSLAYSYDATGNLLTRTDQKGQITAYSYDDAGRLTNRVAVGWPAERYMYDKAGRMTSGERNGWAVLSAYDMLGRMTQNVQGASVVAYAYARNATGDLRQVVYPDGTLVTEQQDLRGRYVSVSRDGQPLATYGHDGVGRVTSRMLANGVTATWGYLANGWLTNLEWRANGGLLAGFAYGYDADGRRIYEHRPHATDRSEAYGYDGIGQVTNYALGVLVGDEVPNPIRRDGWQIDPAGNWDQYVTNGVVQTRQHNAANELVALGQQALTYDDNGNLLFLPSTSGGGGGGEGWILQWDEENRLLAVEGATQRVENVYDFQWRRIEKRTYTGAPGNWTLAATRRFVYDGWNLIQETITSSVLPSSVQTNRFAWGPDLSGTLQGAGGIGGLIAIQSPLPLGEGQGEGSTRFVCYDARGNVIALTDPTAAITARYEYDAYGNPMLIAGADAEVNPFRFSTKYADSETGLVYYGYRYYLPVLGRWLSRDPLGDWAFRHHYGRKKSWQERAELLKQSRLPSYLFTRNTPHNALDALGLRPYYVRKCNIVILYGHKEFVGPLVRDRLMVERCGASCAVTCNSAALRPYLSAMVPGCPLTTKNPKWYAQDYEDNHWHPIGCPRAAYADTIFL